MAVIHAAGQDVPVQEAGPAFQDGHCQAGGRQVLHLHPGPRGHQCGGGQRSLPHPSGAPNLPVDLSCVCEGIRLKHTKVSDNGNAGSMPAYHMERIWRQTFWELSVFLSIAAVVQNPKLSCRHW